MAIAEPKLCRHTGKVRHPSMRAAKVQARLFARELSHRRQLVEDLYTYQCDRCGGWHLTRMPEYDGKQSEKAYTAVDPEYQKWGWS